MQAFEALLTRRSIRHFTDKKIDKNIIQDLLKAAMHAPSAHNHQPWQFIIIDDRKILNVIPQLNPYAKMCKEAPLAILICGDKTKEDFEEYLLQGCSAACQNLLLAAHIKGIGGVWTGVHPKKERMEGIIRLLHLPSHILPIALLVLGCPAEKKEKEDRFDETKIHYNKW